MRASTLLALLPLAMAAPAKRASPAPVIVPRGADLIEGSYIVRLKDGVKASAVNAAVASIQSKADHTYTHFRGFAAKLSEKELKALQENGDVDFIEQDARVHMYDTQAGATWGLARLSSPKANATSYTYDSSAGEGTCAYVVDTGIDVDHEDFEGRAEWLANYADNDNNDGQGHGTHVAGTIGSKTYGVAKKTKLFAVKVLDSSGSGSNSGVIAGMDFVVENASKQDCPNGIVVNMSLGGGYSASINSAAASIVSAGHFLAVAAGNDGVDASNSSPASEESACTVGATERSDTLAYYSNTGKFVDVLAPGTDITSLWPGGETNTISGTSMASPHVAGLAAYFLGQGQKADGLCDYIVSKALDGVISGVGSDTVNKLINNGESA